MLKCLLELIRILSILIFEIRKFWKIFELFLVFRIEFICVDRQFLFWGLFPIKNLIRKNFILDCAVISELLFIII